MTSWRRGLVTSGLATLIVASLAVAPAAAETFKSFKLKSVEGPQRTLSDVMGKVTLVVFFFPTCGYCNAAYPHIQKLYDTYKDRGLSVVLINILPEQEGRIAQWREQYGATVPILLGGRSAPDTYRVSMTPTHFLLDAKATVLSKRAGYKAGDEHDLERSIRQALDAAASARH